MTSAAEEDRDKIKEKVKKLCFGEIVAERNLWKRGQDTNGAEGNPDNQGATGLESWSARLNTLPKPGLRLPEIEVIFYLEKSNKKEENVHV